MAGGFDATLVAAVGFATFVGGLIALKVPAAMAKGLDDQSNKIANELNEAKRLRTEAEALRQSYIDQQAQALAEADAIIAKAHEDAERLKQDAEAELARAIAARKQQAEDRIARAEQSAVADVRAAASGAALAAAELVLKSSTSGKTGQKLIEGGIKALETGFS